MIGINFSARKKHGTLIFDFISLEFPRDIDYNIVFNPDERVLFVKVPHFVRKHLTGEKTITKLVLTIGEDDFKSVFEKAVWLSYIMNSIEHFDEFVEIYFEERNNRSIPHLRINTDLLNACVENLKSNVKLNECQFNLMIGSLEIFHKYNPVFLHLKNNTTEIKNNTIEIRFNSENSPFERDRNFLIVDSFANYSMKIENTSTQTRVCIRSPNNVKTILEQSMLALKNKKRIYEDKEELIQKMKTELVLFKEKSIFYSKQSIYDLMRKIFAQKHNLDTSVKAYSDSKRIRCKDTKKLLVSKIFSHIDFEIKIFGVSSINWEIMSYDLNLYQYDKIIVLEYKTTKKKNVKQSLLKWLSDYALMRIFLKHQKKS